MQKALIVSLAFLLSPFFLRYSMAQNIEFEAVASWSSEGVIRAVVLAENVAIIGSDEEVISLDLSDLSQPEVINRLQVPRWNNDENGQPANVKDLVFHRSYVYAIDEQATVHAIHVDEKGQLTLTASYEQTTPYIGEHVSVENGLLFASSHLAGFGGIDMFNLESPADPQLELNFGSFSQDAVVFGSLICNVTYNTGIYFWNTNLTPPWNPTYTGQIAASTVEVVTGAEKGDGNLFLVGSFLSVMNVSDPRQPELLGQVQLPALRLGTDSNAYKEWSRDVTYADNYVYISDEAGVYVYDVSNPNEPTERLFVETDAWVDDIAVQGDLIFVANREAGITIFRMVTSTDMAGGDSTEWSPHFQVTAPYPNPFHDAIHLSYSMPTTGPIVIKLFDVLGRELGTIENRVAPAGPNQLDWSAGTLPYGVYFVQFNFGTQVETRMIVRVE